MFNENIIQEIDKTLDQLIQNAEVISKVELKDLSETELDAFKKTQESLLQHLIHMDQFLAEKKEVAKELDKRSASYRIQEKLQRFEKLKTQYSKHLADSKERKPIVCKRRSKRFFDFRFRKAKTANAFNK